MDHVLFILYLENTTIVLLVQNMEIMYHNIINNRNSLTYSLLLLYVRLFYTGYMVSDNINVILILWFSTIYFLVILIYNISML